MANRGVVPLDNVPRAQHFCHRVQDRVFPHVHRERQRLQYETITIAIDNHSRQSIAFAPDDAAKLRIDSASRSIFGGLGDAALKKIEIKILFAARETPRHDLRLAVVNRAANQVILPVLERNDITIRRMAERFQHFTRKNPIVSMQNARSRFYNQTSHEGMSNGEWRMPSENSFLGDRWVSCYLLAFPKDDES